ncbi:hypothetical protein ABBQ38_001071 [Trebouxia sp. C0009 RCD-2024]
MQCRTYPFWPEPLTSRHDWEAEALRCEGIRLQSSALPGHHQHQHSGIHHTLQSESQVSDTAVPLETVKKQLVLEEISRSGEMGGSTYDDMDELLTSVSPELVDEFSSDFFASRGRTVLHDSRRWRVLDTWVGDPPIYYRQVPTSVVAVGAMGQGCQLAEPVASTVNCPYLHDQIDVPFQPDPGRSLVLKACPSYAQTEVLVSPGGATDIMKVQHDKLCQPAHRALCLAFALQAMSQKHMRSAAASSQQKPISVHDAPALRPSSELAIAVIGAGACALPMALHHHFPQATVDAVDIDAEALDLAQCYFGAEEDAHLLMHHDDGVKFLTRPGVGSKFDIIMVDVAAPDPAGDPGTLNSIPAQFLSDHFVVQGLQKRLRPGGVAAMNVLGGMPALKQAAASLSPHFQHLHALCTPEASILFGRAPLDSNTDSAYVRTALWRVTAAAAAIKPLSVLCDELLSEQLEQWAVNDAFHDMLRSGFGYGWFSAQDVMKM